MRTAGSGALSLEFARVARALAAAAQQNGWSAPSFRSPPALASAARTVRRRRDGGSVVAVRLRGRPWPAVVGDLIEGVVVVNRLTGMAAAECRERLWSAVAPTEEMAA